MSWSTKLSYALRTDEELANCRRFFPLLSKEQTDDDITKAVERLQNATIDIPGGICIVYSARKQKHWILFRSDKEQEARGDWNQAGDLGETVSKHRRRKRYDFGPSLRGKACHVCSTRIVNRGCRACSQRLCNKHFALHVCNLEDVLGTQLDTSGAAALSGVPAQNPPNDHGMLLALPLDQKLQVDVVTTSEEELPLDQKLHVNVVTTIEPQEAPPLDQKPQVDATRTIEPKEALPLDQKLQVDAITTSEPEQNLQVDGVRTSEPKEAQPLDQKPQVYAVKTSALEEAPPLDQKLPVDAITTSEPEEVPPLDHRLQVDAITTTEPQEAPPLDQKPHVYAVATSAPEEAPLLDQKRLVDAVATSEPEEAPPLDQRLQIDAIRTNEPKETLRLDQKHQVYAVTTSEIEEALPLDQKQEPWPVEVDWIAREAILTEREATSLEKEKTLQDLVAARENAITDREKTLEDEAVIIRKAREARLAKREDAIMEREKALQDLAAAREDALMEREKALSDLEAAISRMKADHAAQPSAAGVARTPKRRPRRRAQRGAVMGSVSPRKRSPCKKRRTSLPAPSSQTRRSRGSRQSGAALISVEEPPPSLTYENIGDCEPVDALLGNFPLPLGISSWDWPLSRDEQKALVLMFDRQELMIQRDEFADMAQHRNLEGKQ